MTVGKLRLAFALADTEAARAFAALLPLTLDMEELNGNEKHGELPKALPTDVSRPARSATAISCCGVRAPWASSIGHP
jgi:hypothetical protein